jgi:hypothetical protein
MRKFDSALELEMTLHLNAYTDELEKLDERLDVVRSACSNKEAFDARLDARMKKFCDATEFLDSWDLIYLESLSKTVRGFLDSEQLS